jgi:S1-C subfamily serine protease
MNQFKPKVSWLLLALFSWSAITVAQEFGFSNLPKPMDAQNSALDVSGISIPHKPEISSTTHFENISRIINDLDSEVVLRGAGSNVFRKFVDGVVVIFSEDGAGAGAIINDDGLVITNWHVIEDANEVGIILRPVGSGLKKQRTYVAKVLRQDKSKDLALVSIENPPSDLTVIPLGNISDIDIGMEVHAIGHPTDRNWSYTKGVVSQIRKSYLWKYGEGQPQHQGTVIQTQTPINPGNSGGPLFSDLGNLVGINSFGDNETEGINYAVSVEHVKQLVKGDIGSGPPEHFLPKLHEKMEQFDVSENGIADRYGFDTDGNGRIDLLMVDEDENRKPDYWILDLNENYEIDGWIYPAEEWNADLTGWMYIFDANEDGDPEIMGFDKNSDGQIDEYWPYTE